MLQLLDLPLEIQLAIFQRCPSRDLRNVACCSSHCNDVLKELLWSHLHIKWSSLVNVDWRHPHQKNKLRNLKYTKKLSFDVVGVRLYKCNSEVTANFQKLLQHCDPGSVQSLCMRGRQIISCVVFAFQLLTGLTNLDIDGSVHWANGLVMDSLIRLSCLVHLNLSNTCIDDLSIISTHLTQLQSLKLDYCVGLSQESVTLCIKNLPQLRVFTVEGIRRVDDTILSVIIENLPLLDHLDVSYTRISDEGMKGIRRLEKLKQLNIAADCRLIGDESLSYVGAMTQLEWLDISGTGTTDLGMEYLLSLVNLKHLVMRSCYEVSDVGMCHAKKLSSLQSLDISYNNFTDITADHLLCLDNLKMLNCVNSGISDVALQLLRAKMRVKSVQF